MGGGGYVATSSLMCRRELYLQDSPMRKILFYDYTLQIQGSLRGGMLYLSDCMSVYRRRVPGSWTAAHLHKGNSSHYRNFKLMLDALDEWTGGSLHKQIQARKRIYDVHSFFRKLLWK